jgi:Tol biopolymer transport system component
MPDGKRIAYVSRESGFDNIFVYDIGEQTSRQLTHANDPFVFTQRPSWSPDSSKIIFKSNRDSGVFQIWTMNADGSDQHVPSPNSANDTDPIWIK